MIKKYNNIIFILFILIINIQIKYSQGVITSNEYPYFHFYYEDNYEFTNNSAHVVWWWYDYGIKQYIKEHEHDIDYELIDAYNSDNYNHYYDVEFITFNISIKNSIDNNFISVVRLSNVSIIDIQTNFYIYLPNYTSIIKDQSFAIHFSGLFHILNNGLYYIAETYMFFKWNPSDRFNMDNTPIEISDNIKYTLISFGGTMILISIYWFIISCKNPYNINSKRCSKDLNKKAKIKKGILNQDKIRNQLFGDNS